MPKYVECHITTRGGLKITLNGQTYTTFCIRWEHLKERHYANGQHSHPSYLKVKTFVFETPDGKEARVHRDKVKGDCDLLTLICPDSYQRHNNSACSSRQPIMHEVDIERDDQGKISLVIDSKSYPLHEVSISVKGKTIQPGLDHYELAEELKENKSLEIVTPERAYSVRFEDLYPNVQRQLLDTVCLGIPLCSLSR